MRVRELGVTLASMALCQGVCAQQFELRPGAGATLVGHTFRVQAATTFDVEVWFHGASTPIPVTSFFGALAFDRTNGIGTAATLMDQKLLMDGYVGLDPSFTIVLTNGQSRAAAASTGAGNNYGYAEGASRPYVFFIAHAPPVGTTVQFTEEPRLLGKYKVRTFGLAAGETYGDDPNEAGLFMAAQGGIGAPQLGGSGFAANSSAESRRVGSTKYAVQVVPEPASTVVLGCSLLSLLISKRRRNSSPTPSASARCCLRTERCSGSV